MDRQTLEQMGKDCMDLITKKVSKQIGREEFYASLIELDRRYPMLGHNPPLTAFQLRNYYTIKMIIKDPDTGVFYEDHLQPFNFQEAAEMFIRHQQKLDEECLPLSAWKKKEWPLTERPKHKEVRQERLPYKDEEEVPF